MGCKRSILGTELIVVAHHSKSGRVGFAYLVPVERVTTLVTDSKTPLDTWGRLKEIGIWMIVADLGNGRS